MVHGNIASNEYERALLRIKKIVADSGGAISQNDLTRKTQFLKLKERTEAIENLKESGGLFEGFRHTSGRASRGYGLSIRDLDRSGWTLLTAEVLEAAIANKKAGKI